MEVSGSYQFELNARSVNQILRLCMKSHVSFP